MDDQQQRVEQVFGAALELSPPDRDAFLGRTCAHEPEVRKRVEALLLAHERAGSFLENLPEFHVRPGLADATQMTAPVEDPQPRVGTAKKHEAGRFEPGQVIADRFTVVRFIAHGGMGEVYEVDDRYLQHVHIALKVILPEIAADEGSAQRFEQEVLLARKVTHPNLCPIYDIARCEEPGPPFLFLTMKLLQGETLAGRLRRIKPISRAEALAIFHQMIAGLGAIHAAGVVHRDIKPNNVMLDYSGGDLCLSIMDFGLARLHESETTLATRGLVAGTPGYIAPELFQGHRPSQAADIYALGVLLHQVLTGAMPGSRADSMAAEPLPALAAADVPAAVKLAVTEFLAEEPRRRCEAFSRLLVHDAHGAEPGDGSPHKARTQLSRRHMLIGSAAVACAAAGGVVLERDHIADWLHPLPRKRFVALLDWPTTDARLKPMLLGVIDAIAGELSRAEAFDRDLFVIAPPTSSDLTTPAQLNEARESLGANLVLAAYGAPRGKHIHLSLRVLDPDSTESLREDEMSVPFDRQGSLPEMAVHAAARLLNVENYSADEQRTRPGTNSLEALAAYQSAEALMIEPNDAGLDGAIEKYKQAVELDPHYAEAYAKLAQAYSRLYVLRGDAAAIALAQANCESALRENPNSVSGHVARAWIYQELGDHSNASSEIAKALAIDPSNQRTLTRQAQLYAAMGEWPRAEGTLARVLAMRPNYWLAHNELGVIFDSQGKYTQAAAQFRAASLAAPKNAMAFANLGDVYLKLGDVQQALESTQKSFALSPNDAAAATLAALYRVQRNYAKAIASAEKATALAPSEAVDWLELGDCYDASKVHKAEAISAYMRAVQVQQEHLRIEAKYGPGWMLLALCSIKAGRGETAAALIAKADALHADDMDSQLYKARAFEILGRRAEAASILKQCVKRGAAPFQLALIPDLESLRADAAYRDLFSSGVSST